MAKASKEMIAKRARFRSISRSFERRDTEAGTNAGEALVNAYDQRTFVLAFIKAVDPITLAHFVAECDATPSPTKRKARS